MKNSPIIFTMILSGAALCSGASFDRSIKGTFGSRRTNIKPENEVEPCKVDDYEVAEDKIFHAVENAELAALHAVEHIVEDEVDSIFHDLPKHEKKIEPDDSKKKVKNVADEEDPHVRSRRHIQEKLRDTLEEMLAGNME